MKRLVIGVALALLVHSAAFAGPFIISTGSRASVAPQGRASSSDFDSANGVATSESYVEIAGVLGGKWFASSKAEPDGNIEVGVDNGLATLLRGNSSAVAGLDLQRRYVSGAQVAAVEFTIQAAEILFTTSTTHAAPQAGTHDGFFKVELIAFVNGLEVISFEYLLGLTSTDSGLFEIDRFSNNALSQIDQTFTGAGAKWGVTTRAYDGVLLLPPLEPNDVLFVNNVMTAEGKLRGLQDVGSGISVKIGDPLNPGSRGSITLPADATREAAEPGEVWLVTTGILAALSVRSRQRAFRSSSQPHPDRAT